MRIGVGVPCRFSDIDVLERYLLPSVAKLDPRPHAVKVFLNDGHPEGLGGIKRELYDHLFIEKRVDVVLCADADMMLFPNILRFVKRDVIVDFGHIVRAPFAQFCKMVTRMIVDKPLCGCLSIPRELWFNKIRENPEFNGIDSSIIRSVDIRRDFEPLKFPPKFMLVRRSRAQYRENLMRLPKNRELGLFKRSIYFLGTLRF